MNKGAFNTFTFIINFLTLDWEPKHVTIGFLRQKGLLGLVLLVNCKLCLRSTNLLTISIATWKMKTQTYLQCLMFLNILLLVKNWECMHHLHVFVLVMPFLRLANLPLLIKRNKNWFITIEHQNYTIFNSIFYNLAKKI